VKCCLASATSGWPARDWWRGRDGIGLTKSQKSRQRAGAERLIQRGAAIALIPMLLQIPSGLWVALQIPESARDPLFGGDWFASGLFAAALLLALV